MQDDEALTYHILYLVCIASTCYRFSYHPCTSIFGIINNSRTRTIYYTNTCINNFSYWPLNIIIHEYKSSYKCVPLSYKCSRTFTKAVHLGNIKYPVVAQTEVFRMFTSTSHGLYYYINKVIYAKCKSISEYI